MALMATFPPSRDVFTLPRQNRASLDRIKTQERTQNSPHAANRFVSSSFLTYHEESCAHTAYLQAKFCNTTYAG